MPENDSPNHRRDSEKALLIEVRRTKLVYQQAVENSLATAQQYRDLQFGHPDGEKARREASLAEAVALEKYSNAVRLFTNLVLRGKLPDPER